ncbi:MAG: DMT family transporter [Treponema sp.]|nr:DMT family transporter [Treponema sp.]
MNKRSFGADLLLLLTAAIWGFGFVAQPSVMEYLGPFAFSGIRFILGSASLLPFICGQNARRKKYESGPPAAGFSFKAVLITGLCIFTAVSLQQIGIIFTTAGNAGFITGLYVVLTPIIGIFLGRKTVPAMWIGAIFTLTGLYFISVTGGSFSKINPGDVFVAGGAVFWAFHVLIIDRFVQKEKNDPIILSSGQYAVCGLISLAAAFLAEPSIRVWVDSVPPELFEKELPAWLPFASLLRGLVSGDVPLAQVSGAVIPIMYGGLASVGIAYTLQVVAQQYTPPAHAAIILCLEGSFAALGGIIFLDEPLGVRTVVGFTMMLAGMLISQLGLGKRR